MPVTDEPDPRVTRVDELRAELYDLAATSLAGPLRPDTRGPMQQAASHAAAIAETLSDELRAVDPNALGEHPRPGGIDRPARQREDPYSP